ncbi:hypothetical protein SmJEL517_g01640 [Synchytrium microbalum]|uniref:Uncharacterized protein n=1 Tax=Synchytrium microbalum TaxID=1806994 RepID=A0A507CE18_9FUNG|nr:uncharacterized protein SmJEL517_g01640 [Synchytrium microbalum]TPX36286.1 hypothetical protein SmJEL517_g01640 [Synchytrium microbalum]
MKQKKDTPNIVKPDHTVTHLAHFSAKISPATPASPTASPKESNKPTFQPDSIKKNHSNGIENNHISESRSYVDSRENSYMSPAPTPPAAKKEKPLSAASSPTSTKRSTTAFRDVPVIGTITQITTTTTVSAPKSSREPQTIGTITQISSAVNGVPTPGSAGYPHIPTRTFSKMKGVNYSTGPAGSNGEVNGSSNNTTISPTQPAQPTTFKSRLEASASHAPHSSLLELSSKSNRSLQQLGARLGALGLGPPTGNQSSGLPGAFLTPEALIRLSSTDPRIRKGAATNEMNALANASKAGAETVMSAWARLIRQAAAGGVFEKRLEALERAHYCGQEHQKEDWKLHKSVCDRLKLAKIDEATLGWPVSLPPLNLFTEADLAAVDNWTTFVDRFLPFGEKWNPPANAPGPQKDFHLSLHRCLTDVVTYPFTIALTLRHISVDVSRLKRPLRIHILTFPSTDIPDSIPPIVLPRCLDAILLGHSGIDILCTGPDVDPYRDAVEVEGRDVKQRAWKGLYNEWRTCHYRTLEPVPDLAVLFHPMLSTPSALAAALPSLRIFSADQIPVLITDPDEGDYTQTILQMHESAVRIERTYYAGKNPWAGEVERQSNVFLNRVSPTNGFMQIYKGLKG